MYTEWGPIGQWPDALELFYFPNGCMHCEHPSCIDVCPTKATFKTDEGVVLVDANRCFGCQYCVWACPYEAALAEPQYKMSSRNARCALTNSTLASSRCAATPVLRGRALLAT